MEVRMREFDIPKGSILKHLPFPYFLVALSLMLSSCWPVLTRPAAGQLGEPALLTGRAENWLGRPLTIKLGLRRITPRVTEYVGGGTINAAGDFSILLPGLAQMAPYIGPIAPNYAMGTCSKLSVIPVSAQNSYSAHLGVFDGTTQVGRISLEPSTNVQVGDVITVLQFVDRDTDINVVCSDAGLTNHFHQHLAKGWFFDVSEWSDTTHFHEYVDDIPNTNRWTFARVP
jgi:hypothetical protein